MAKDYENPIRKPQGSAEIRPYSKEEIESKELEAKKREFLPSLPKENPFKSQEKKDPPMKRAQSPDKLPKQQYT